MRDASGAGRRAASCRRALRRASMTVRHPVPPPDGVVGGAGGGHGCCFGAGGAGAGCCVGGGCCVCCCPPAAPWQRGRCLARMPSQESSAAPGRSAAASSSAASAMHAPAPRRAAWRGVAIAQARSGSQVLRARGVRVPGTAECARAPEIERLRRSFVPKRKGPRAEPRKERAVLTQHAPIRHRRVECCCPRIRRPSPLRRLAAVSVNLQSPPPPPPPHRHLPAAAAAGAAAAGAAAAPAPAPRGPPPHGSAARAPRVRPASVQRLR